VASTLVLIWFTAPLARLAELIIPRRAEPVVPEGEPLYLDDASLAAPALGLQKVRLEVARLGELLLQMTHRAIRAATAGDAAALEAVRSDGAEIDRLGSAILQYLGKLSEVEHTTDDSQQLIALIETVNNLESIVDVVSTNLVTTGQQRLAERVDLVSLRDESTARFANYVTDTLAAAVAGLSNVGGKGPQPFTATKAEMQSLTSAARTSVFEKVDLADVKDVLRYRLANDLIEQLRHIGRLSLRIAKNLRRA